MSSNPQYFQTKINANEMPAEVSRFREANLSPRGAHQIQNSKQKVRARDYMPPPPHDKHIHARHARRSRRRIRPGSPSGALGASAGTAATGRTRVAIGWGARRWRCGHAVVGTRREGRPPDRAALRRSITWNRSTLVSTRDDVRRGGPLSRSLAAVWSPTRGPPCQRSERSRECRRRRQTPFVHAR